MAREYDIAERPISLAEVVEEFKEIDRKAALYSTTIQVDENTTTHRLRIKNYGQNLNISSWDKG